MPQEVPRLAALTARTHLPRSTAGPGERPVAGSNSGVSSGRTYTTLRSYGSASHTRGRQGLGRRFARSSPSGSTGSSPRASVRRDATRPVSRRPTSCQPAQSQLLTPRSRRTGVWTDRSFHVNRATAQCRHTPPARRRRSTRRPGPTNANANAISRQLRLPGATSQPRTRHTTARAIAHQPMVTPGTRAANDKNRALENMSRAAEARERNSSRVSAWRPRSGAIVTATNSRPIHAPVLPATAMKKSR